MESVIQLLINIKVPQNILRQCGFMQRNMVNIVELAHVVELLDRHASRRVINKALQSAGLDRAMLSDATGFHKTLICGPCPSALGMLISRGLRVEHRGAS